MARFRHRLGTILIALGILALVYGATIYLWRDPVTDLYARWKQNELAGELDRVFAEQREAAGLQPVPDAPHRPRIPDPRRPSRPRQTRRSLRRRIRRRRSARRPIESTERSSPDSRWGVS